MKLVLRYFTGTGNTARACALIEKEFVNAGWEVDSRVVRAAMPQPYAEIETADLLLAAFPVLGFSPPTIMRKWLARLPRRKGQAAAVLAVGGAIMLNDRYVPGWGAGAPFSAAAALTRRGRTVLGIGEVSYPDNFTQATNPPDEAGCARIRALNDPATVDFGKRLIAAAADSAVERPFLRRHLAVRSIMAVIGFFFRVLGRRVLAKSYIADRSCTGCGLCARVCPARAISLRRGRPRWGLRCVACNRCINLCPSGSIKTSTAVLISHFALSILIFAFALSVPLPRELLSASRIAIRVGLLIVLSVLQVGPIASGLIALSRVSAVRGFFESSFMAKFRRYRDPSFHPET